MVVVPGSVVPTGRVVCIGSLVGTGVVVDESDVKTLVVVMSPGTEDSAGIEDDESVGATSVVEGCSVVAGVDGVSLDDEKKRNPTTARMNTTAMAPSVTGVKEMFFTPPMNRDNGEPDAKPSGSFSFFFTFLTFFSLPSAGSVSAAPRRRRDGDSVGIVGDGPNEPGWASWKPPGCGIGGGAL
jgi:hypothetical protein